MTEAAARPAAGTGVVTDRRPLAILLAEDNLVNRRLVAAVLGDLGHRVEAVADGAAAVAAAARGSFDLILMDIEMPGIDGLEATRRIRALGGGAGRTPIIALTANAEPGDRARVRAAGMNDHVAKPIDLAALAQAIERARTP